MQACSDDAADLSSGLWCDREPVASDVVDLTAAATDDEPRGVRQVVDVGWIIRPPRAEAFSRSSALPVSSQQCVYASVSALGGANDDAILTDE